MHHCNAIFKCVLGVFEGDLAAVTQDGCRLRRECRKGTQVPYILHPMEAAVIVGSMTEDQNLIAAAALHDVVEDAGVAIEEIEEKFGPRVRELLSPRPRISARISLRPTRGVFARKNPSLC